MNSVIQNIKARRTTRKYQSQQVSKEMVESIIEAGLYAPSGHNKQPWHFTVVQNQALLAEMNIEAKEAAKAIPDEMIQKMAHNEHFHIFYNAPTVIVVSGNEEGLTTRDDCAAATQNMLLAAESLGLGACWNGMVSMLFMGEKADAYVAKLGIPEGCKPFYAVALGHKDAHATNAPARKANTVNYIL